eukprot:TRINITY_DN3464_c0_g1_i2.p1 TRINITY_DN3464_c0_g1~~TRINITY_DN3464_c0_g1_i2.p1  ORF type:complete len:118 (-),score=33.48 TRINITY_DN3464_c0_g1_i2:7-360(-)
MAQPAQFVFKPLTLEEARAAVAAVAAAFDQPENAAKMAAAKAEAGDDIAKNMMLVLPVAIQIQMSNIAQFGYEPTQQGVTQFMAAVRQHEQDSVVAGGMQTLKEKFLPKLPQAPART